MKTDMNDYYKCMNEILLVLHKYKNKSLRPSHIDSILRGCIDLVRIDFNDTTDDVIDNDK
jgi:hypothetical protein